MDQDAQAQDLLGETFEAVAATLGAPDRQEQFTLGPAVPEFRVELRNFFDDERRADDPPQIREATWSQSPERNLTIWFERRDGAWTALHYHAWHPEDQF